MILHWNISRIYYCCSTRLEAGYYPCTMLALKMQCHGRSLWVLQPPILHKDSQNEKKKLYSKFLSQKIKNKSSDKEIFLSHLENATEPPSIHQLQLHCCVRETQADPCWCHESPNYSHPRWKQLSVLLTRNSPDDPDSRKYWQPTFLSYCWEEDLANAVTIAKCLKKAQEWVDRMEAGWQV